MSLTRLKGTENLPEEPCVIVGNHSHMYGPIAGELYTPGKHQVWCAGEMMHWNEVHDYAYRDFWSDKPLPWFFRFLSYLITPLAVCLFNNAHTVAVYHDTRLISTFRESMLKGLKGSLPMKAYKDESITFRYVYRSASTGKTRLELTFTPEDYE